MRNPRYEHLKTTLGRRFGLITTSFHTAAGLKLEAQLRPKAPKGRQNQASKPLKGPLS